ncbi:nitroreductase family deazaflavin-dependent oxidoreductase [Amycolatopsis benzoatilytica]|uniref:nitroreductase family deazaflavin-dependent oxidoreductase n=1 Tax=Amycolatopsis benzoatilytica TaxID=346045 RepID=UPI000361778D|nr:nitroreductase family deazaflavin-dependent oxidoreductase [Amycolatopsis benzoatilytica]
MSARDRLRATALRHNGSEAIRSFNKHVLNPAVMRFAGGRFGLAVIRHTGRRTGTAYATPVTVDRVETGFIIALPYGTRTDWLLNVRAAGNATLEFHGETWQVSAPEIIDAAVALPQLPPAHARILKRTPIKHYLKLAISPAEPGGPPADEKPQ